MIRRSVPGYGLIIPSIALLARRYVQPGSNLYDLGCSLGAVSLAILDALPDRDNRLIAIDNSPEMIDQFRLLAVEREASRDDPPGERIELEIAEGDILDAAIENASFVVLNFTLQFINPSERTRLLERIASAMRPGGALVLSEKLQFGDGREHSLQYAWHLDFKRAQGYSELEISRKRDALEQTLKPDTTEVHSDRLKRAGFGEAYRWFQCFNFASFVAIR
jgi:tRNA (cmo5U34)-methyltransferase